MPNVVSSVLTIEPGTDVIGRVRVTETHTDLLGAAHAFSFLAAPDDPALNTNMAERAVNLGLALAAQEIAANMDGVRDNGSAFPLSLAFSTNAENFAGLHATYLTATEAQAAMVGDFLSALTDAQLQGIFSMTAGQVTTLRANKLTSNASTAAAIRAAVGQ